MNAGKLKHRIVIDRAIDTQTETGDMVRTWQPIADTYADIQPLRGREFFADGAVRGDIDTTITVRWSPLMEGLTEKHRIRHKTTIYNIVGPPAHIGIARREMEIRAKTGITDGR